jgi:S1-C subfamily serine protease
VVRRGLVLLLLPFLAACGTTSRTTTVVATKAASPGSLQTTFEQVVQRVLPQVVQISTAEGLGSGIVFDGKGDIVTNAHVVGTAARVSVVTSTGTTYRSARVVGRFAPDDLAVVHVAGTPPAATFADSSLLAVGEIVLAVGNPLGLSSSVTEGIVSALGRTSTESSGATLAGLIQTSASINPGNSGGALVDLHGRVVGIPTLAAGSPFGGAAPGIGFAIPSNTIRTIATQLVEHGHVTQSGRAYLGIDAATLQTETGVLVTHVVPGTGAAKAGLRQGDVIVALDGKSTPTLEALAQLLAQRAPGQTVHLRLSGGRTAAVRLGQLPG